MRNTDTNLDSVRLRRQLILLAYRMLGSVADAEDIVQEAFLRYEAPGKPVGRVATRLP